MKQISVGIIVVGATIGACVEFPWGLTVLPFVYGALYFLVDTDGAPEQEDRPEQEELDDKLEDIENQYEKTKNEPIDIGEVQDKLDSL